LSRFDSESQRAFFIGLIMRSGTRRFKVLWLGAAGLITFGIYCGCAYIGTAVCGNDDPSQVVYNRMIAGFAHGRLNLDRDVPMGFAMLDDPYDPKQNEPYRAPPYFLYDLSYYHGRLYAYFGPVPALLLFGPYHLLTGRYLSYKAGAVFLCMLGFLATAWVVVNARRRYTPDTPDWVVAMILLTFGLASGLPTLLARVDVWEIPIAGATALILCMVAALWQAWHQAAKRGRWLAAASLCLGLAVGTRPTAILIAPVLIMPLVREWQEFRFSRGTRILSGAALPFLFSLGALGLYNEARFGNPLEFGQTYQLAALQYVGRLRQYGFDYVWDNVRIYFLNFTPWTTTFPFIGAAPKLVLHPGHATPEFCFGILGNDPVVLMALTALWVRKRKDGLSFLARVFLWIAVAQIGLLMVFFGAVSRYEIEILTPLLGLAAIGMLAIESRGSGRYAARGLWIALGTVSVAFNLAHSAVYADWTRKKASYWFFSLKQTQAALEEYNVIRMLEPPSAGLLDARGVALGLLSRWSEAASDFEEAVRVEPGNADAQCNLGTAYVEENEPAAAIAPLRESIRLRPDDPRARETLARALLMLAAQAPPQSR
jgi:tetratricopeptide (TPR) repeat protein